VIRLLFKEILLKGRVTGEIASDFDLEKIQRNLGNDKGIGRPLILKFLDGVPGFTDHMVKSQLQNLKDSGDYDRTIREVIEEVATEQSAERAELERRERDAAQAKAETQAAETERIKAEEELRRTEDKAAKKAARAKAKAAKLAAAEAKRKQAEKDKKVAKLTEVKTARDISDKALVARNKAPKFNLAGVSLYLKTERQISEYRRIVMEWTSMKRISFDQQAVLAREVAQGAQERNQELTAEFVRLETRRLLNKLYDEARRTRGEELKVPFNPLAQFFSKDDQKRTTEKIMTAVRALNSIADLKEDHPQLEATQELQSAVNQGCVVFANFKSLFNF